MSVELNEVQQKLINKIAKENGFNEYEIKTAQGSKKGDNYLGILTTVNLKEGEKKLDLILKSADQSESFRKTMPLREAYIREIYMYKNIFGAFKKFQEDSNISDPFDSYAKLYGETTEEGNECFVMENLKAVGYQLWNKQIPMNPEHISSVLREYAKLHAVSLVMKHKNPELFAELTDKLSKNVFVEGDNPEDLEKKMGEYKKFVMNNAYTALKDDAALIEFLKKFEIRIGKTFEELDQPEYKVVLTHGDCWCNNILFKYQNDDHTKPTSLRIIDWQLSSLSSPAYDICYFFLAHSPKEVLNDYKHYLHLYYETLSKQIKDFNCDPEEIFSFDRFQEHIKRYMHFGLYMCFTILRVLLCDSDEALNFSEIKEGENMLDSMNFNIKNFDILKERLTNLIIFIKTNYWSE